MHLASQKPQKHIVRISFLFFIIFTMLLLPSCGENSRDSDWSVNLDINNLYKAHGMNSRFEKDLSVKLRKLEGRPQIEIANVLLNANPESDFLIYYSVNSNISIVNIYIEVAQEKCNSFAIYSDLRVDRSDCNFQGARFYRPTIKEDIIFDDNSYEILVVRRSGKVARYVDPISPNLLESRGMEDYRRAIAESFLSVGSNEPVTNDLKQEARREGGIGLAK